MLGGEDAGQLEGRHLLDGEVRVHFFVFDYTIDELVQCELAVMDQRI